MSLPQSNKDRCRWIIGCMTGTSLDGLDATLVHISGEGLDLEARCVGWVSKSLDGLAGVLGRFCSGQTAAPMEYLCAARELGVLHAEAVAQLLDLHLPRGQTLDFVAAHGQTICHEPTQCLSWQLLDPQPIVQQAGVPVCFDLRQADLLAGGEGAPLTPIADWVLYRSPHRHRSIINLGGICNITELPTDIAIGQISARDLVPCNLFVDAVVQSLFSPHRFDQGGLIATRGTPQDSVYPELQRLVSAATDRKRSLGREDISQQWLSDFIDRCSQSMPPEDVLASAVDSVGRCIGGCMKRGRCSQAVLAGGGSRNQALVEAIRQHSGSEVHLIFSDELGIPCEAREAVCMAVLGALCQDGVPIALPQVTGAREPVIAGRWVY